jgi:hypothetical protein
MLMEYPAAECNVRYVEWNVMFVVLNEMSRVLNALKPVTKDRNCMSMVPLVSSGKIPGIEVGYQGLVVIWNRIDIELTYVRRKYISHLVNSKIRTVFLYPIDFRCIYNRLSYLHKK